MGIDYYGVLSLKRNCDTHDIKRAFRRLILQYNPERQNDPSVEVIFATIAEAYDVLSDHFRRAVYDQYGEEGLKRGAPGADGYIQPYVFHGDPARTFREFFGCDNPHPDLLDALWKPVRLYDMPEGKGVKHKESPLIRPLLLTLHEIYHGGVKKLKINRLELTGKDSTTTEMREKVLSVPIKPGLPSGTKITFPEEGDQGPTIIPVPAARCSTVARMRTTRAAREAAWERGHCRGCSACCGVLVEADVIFITEERPHERFKREGDNLVMFCNINLKDALVGMRVVVKTLDERTFFVNITDVVHPEYEKIIEGEGMPILETPLKRGNLIIRFKVEFPKYLPRASKNLIQEAWESAKFGNKGEPDQIYKLVMLDKINRISKKEDMLI